MSILPIKSLKNQIEHAIRLTKLLQLAIEKIEMEYSIKELPITNNMSDLLELLTDIADSIN